MQSLVSHLFPYFPLGCKKDLHFEQFATNEKVHEH